MWTPIPNYDGYEVSDLGEVRCWNPANGVGKKGSAEKPRLLSPSPFQYSGYLRVGITNSITGKTDYRRVHQLVLEGFIGPKPSPKHIVMHLDDDCQNNSLKNLKYGTNKENGQDMANKGRSSKGESHPKSITSDAIRNQIIDLAKLKTYKGSRLEIAETLSVPINVVRRTIEGYVKRTGDRSVLT